MGFDQGVTEILAAVGSLYAAVRTVFLAWRAWRNTK